MFLPLFSLQITTLTYTWLALQINTFFPCYYAHIIPEHLAAHDSSALKRGLSFHDPPIYVQDFNDEGSQVNWAYNWYSNTDDSFPEYLEFVPMLWGDSPDHTLNWAKNVERARKRGSTHLLAFNEPDACEGGGSCITPEAAVTSYLTHIQPFANDFRLGAPAVTNSANGLPWLDKFLRLCVDCTIDFVPLHWYDSSSNSAYLRDYLGKAQVIAGDRNLWITEFSASGSMNEQVEFLTNVIPWMDAQSRIERYAWFWCDPSALTGQLINAEAQLTDLGKAYAYDFVGE